MRRFRFRLERILELRRAQLRAREHEVAGAQRLVREAEDRVAAHLAERRTVGLRSRRALHDGVAAELGWIEPLSVAWEQACENAREKVKEAERERDRRIALLQEVRSAVEALERLRSQQERQHRRDRRRQEEKAMDERHLWSMVDEQPEGDSAEGREEK